MSTNSLYVHGMAHNEVLISILNRLNYRSIPFNIINSQTPKRILEKLSGISYNTNTHFLICCDYNGEITYKIMSSYCEFTKYINNLILEQAQII